jgi:hypothetical protein
LLKIHTNFCIQENQANLQNLLRFSKNQVDLRNIGALQKSGGFTKYWRPAEKQADNGILAGVEIPVPGEKPAELEKAGSPLLFRLGGISSC